MSKPKKQQPSEQEKTKPAAQPQKDPKALQVLMRAGETAEAALARSASDSSLLAANTLMEFHPLRSMLDLNALRSEMEAQVQSVVAGDLSKPEAMLTAQAHTLDTLFGSMALLSAKCMNLSNLHGAETYMRMALKAQSQCRTTIEALAEIKNPSGPTFVKQQNIAQNQQVNNGVPSDSRSNTHARAQEKDITPTNELLEAPNGERMDIGTTRTASGAHSDLAAVGAVNRAKD